MIFYFFFQAEDGIRYHCVTGVQTCALPIYGSGIKSRCSALIGWSTSALVIQSRYAPRIVFPSPGTSTSIVETPTIGTMTLSEVGRSEERRVGKECRSG